MSITAYRGALWAASAALLTWTVPALAQADQRTAINILVECSKIDDPTARLACYDNNIAQAANSIPNPLSVPPRGLGGAVPQGQGPQGFGAESLRVQQERFTPRPSYEEQIEPVVAAIREREPGVYLFTLKDGAEWVFAESVDRFYKVPRVGDTVEIERGAMGGFLLQFADQKSVSVRRVR